MGSIIKISAIVAIDKNNLMGMDNGIPWHIPADLENFKDLTEGKAVVMGRNTWESLPVKPLPNRLNMVVSGDANFYIDHPVMNAYSLEDAMDSLYWGIDEVFIIGGARMYKDAAPIVGTLYLTRVNREIEDNGTGVYFPIESYEGFIERSRIDYKTHTNYVYVRN